MPRCGQLKSSPGDIHNLITLLWPMRKADFWYSVCRCGNFLISKARNVRRGHTKSCGCLKLSIIKSLGRAKRKGDGWPSQINAIIREATRGKYRKKMEFALSYDQVKHIVQQDCAYCGAEPAMANNHNVVKRNGIDRLDSAVGYTLENCVPCCAMCNFMKHTYSVDDFLQKVTQIYRHQATNVRFKKRS